MCVISEPRVSTPSSASISNEPISEVATSTSASAGHWRNQSIVQPLISAGNFCARVRNLSPTGEKHNTMWRWWRTRSMKKVHRSS